MNRLYLKKLRVFPILCLLCLILNSIASLADFSAATIIENKSGNRQWFKLVLPESELISREGHTVDLYNDVFADKVIVIDFVYTSCTTACPLVSAIFSKLQQRLDQRMGKIVRLVSLSLNPESDTPARLKRFANHFDAGSEWFWLTGQKAQMDKLIEAFGVLSADYSTHPPVLLVGDAARGQWLRLNGLASPDQIIAKIDEFVAARQ